MTTREDALPCSYTRRADPTRGKLDILETKAGEFGLGSFCESRRWGGGDCDDRGVCEVDAVGAELGVYDWREPMIVFHLVPWIFQSRKRRRAHCQTAPYHCACRLVLARQCARSPPGHRARLENAWGYPWSLDGRRRNEGRSSSPHNNFNHMLYDLDSM